MNTYLKKSCLIFISLFGDVPFFVIAQLSEPLPFMTHAKPLSAEIVDIGMLDTVPSTAALVVYLIGKRLYGKGTREMGTFLCEGD